MSQMPHPAARPVCPSCEEPLESGDLFCGACGHDLSAVPPPPGDHPTLVINNAPDGVPVAGTEWPTAAGTDGSVTDAATYRAEELLELESSGSRLPAHPGDFELPAPLGRVPGTPARGASAPEATGPVSTGSGATGPVPTGPVPASPAPASPAPTSASASASVEAAADPAGDPVDPRTADPALTAPTGSKVCVACRVGRVDTDGYCENCGHAQPRERDHMEQELGAVAAVSDRGLRHHRNEDAFAVSSAALPDGSPAVVAVVCDGVSSATRPDDASAAAASSANESLLGALERGTHPRQAMHDAIVVVEATRSTPLPYHRPAHWTATPTTIRTPPRARSSARWWRAVC